MRLKYGNTRTNHAGYSFASKAEAALFDLLKLREIAGEISDIRTQVQVKLTKAKIVYIPDFKYLENGVEVYAEFKGLELDTFRLKKRLWEFYGPGKLEIWRGHYGKIFLAETVIPKIVTSD